MAMIHLPALRWGEPYASLDFVEAVHFDTGEPVAHVSQVLSAMVRHDLKHAARARAMLRSESPVRLVEHIRRAGDLFMNAELPLGSGSQTPEEFVHQQSSTTGLPEAMCRANMDKLAFVCREMGNILDSLTRGLDLEILSTGFGLDESGRMLSYQAQADVVGAVLPSNSPGVHTLWIPAIPLQVGLCLKPGSQEPWSPYRMAVAMIEAGIPREAVAVYHGGHDVGQTITQRCGRTLVFGGQATMDLYSGNPAIQVHGPGYSKILIGDDAIDNWPDHLDTMADSVFLNSGRSCINTSSIWVPRHARAIAEALANRFREVGPKDPRDPEASLAAFTVSGVAEAVSGLIDDALAEGGATDVTAEFRAGSRAITRDHCSYLLPTVVHCESPDHPLANKEFMFPFVSVVECPESEMISRIGPTLVCTGITESPVLQQRLVSSTSIDRLNLGSIPTTKLDWLQPHEGNIVEWLYQPRSFQMLGGPGGSPAAIGPVPADTSMPA